MDTPELFPVLLGKKFFEAKKLLRRVGSGGVLIFPFVPVKRFKIDIIVLKPGTLIFIGSGALKLPVRVVHPLVSD